jgi:hypothetical protein
MVIEIPLGVITDIQQWVQVQNIEFFLYDQNHAGNTNTTELLAYASVPLIRVLLSTRKPLTAVIELIRTDCTRNGDNPTLEVAFSDQTQERLNWAKVVDSYMSNEDIWLMKYSEKMKIDLGQHTLRKMPENDRLGLNP